MKIIDLLNKIANGEEAPKKIKWGDTKYTLYIDEDTKHTYYQDDKCRLFFLNIKCLDNLNDEVEIIEEEKKIPEKLEYHQVRRNEVEVDYIEDGIVKHFCLNKKQRYFVDKINEILDYLKNKGE